MILNKKSILNFFFIDIFELSSHYISWKLFWQISYGQETLLNGVQNSFKAPGIELQQLETTETVDTTNLAIGRIQSLWPLSTQNFWTLRLQFPNWILIESIFQIDWKLLQLNKRDGMQLRCRSHYRSVLHYRSDANNR